jgi:hypothetical protein
MSGGHKSLALPQTAQLCLDRGGGSNVWFQDCFKRWSHIIKEKAHVNMDIRRVVKHTEVTVQDHFWGEHGLETKLIAPGIMDPDTKIITDASRILNFDETLQFLDYGDGKGVGQELTACAPSTSPTTAMQGRKRRDRERGGRAIWLVFGP